MSLEENLKAYIDENDFWSALRQRNDDGAIYTNKIIYGWIESTYRTAWKAAHEDAQKELTPESTDEKALAKIKELEKLG